MPVRAKGLEKALNHHPDTTLKKYGTWPSLRGQEDSNHLFSFPVVPLGTRKASYVLATFARSTLPLPSRARCHFMTSSGVAVLPSSALDSSLTHSDGKNPSVYSLHLGLKDPTRSPPACCTLGSSLGMPNGERKETDQEVGSGRLG